MSNRKYRNTPEYFEWRKKVLKRDKHKCRFPGCKKRAKQVHHILRWADAPSLRYEVSNGISLCWACHYNIRNQEHLYVELFIRIIMGL